MSNPTTAPISLRAYAKRRGVSAMAVSKAISSGRLRASVVRDERGQPKIADPDLADREWDAGTDHSRAPGYVKERASARAAGVPPPGPIPAPLPASAPRVPPAPGEAIQEPENLSLSLESAREKFWKAQTAEADYRERIGELVDAKEMAALIADAFTRTKTRLLAVPTRARQLLPQLGAPDVAVLDSIVREALEELVVELAPAPASSTPPPPSEAAVG